jgi:hypothetical protein
MNCKEFPKRFQVDAEGVIHAATTYKRWLGRNVPYEEDAAATACGKYSKTYNLKQIDNTAVITCKACLKAMNLHEKPIYEKRYVLQEIESGFFFKKSSYSRSNWTEHFLDATLYKIKGALENANKITEFFDKNENKMSYNEFYAVGGKERKEKGYHSVTRFPHEKYKIRTVLLTLERE